MIELIDVNCRIGAGPADPAGTGRDLSGLLEYMDRFHVTRAVVYTGVARYAETKRGNALLDTLTAGSGRFIKSWVLLPGLWDCAPAPEEQVRQMLAAGATAARLFPAQYGHSMRRYAAGELMDALARHHIPALISFDQFPSWDAVYDLCRDYPENSVILCGAGYRCLRHLVPIMERCENLYAETGSLLMHNGLERLCAYMGAERFLYGSGYPETSIAASASQLLLSDLKREDKQKIGGGNLLRLLGEVQK